MDHETKAPTGLAGKPFTYCHAFSRCCRNAVSAQEPSASATKHSQRLPQLSRPPLAPFPCAGTAKVHKTTGTNRLTRGSPALLLLGLLAGHVVARVDRVGTAGPIWRLRHDAVGSRGGFPSVAGRFKGRRFVVGNPHRGGSSCESVLSDGCVDRGLCCRGTGVAILVLGGASRQHVYASQGGDAIQRLALLLNYGVQLRSRISRLGYQAASAWSGCDYVAQLYEVPGTYIPTDSTTHTAGQVQNGQHGNQSRSPGRKACRQHIAVLS